MALIRWEPTRELTSLQGEMNRLFNTFLDTPANADSPSRWVPPMDLAEQADDYIVTADLPGMDEHDVTIELENNVLSISGERQHDASSNGGTDYHRVERARGAFRRELTLPAGVDPDSIEATFDRGVLEIRVPKPEQRKPRRVQISAVAKTKSIDGTAKDSAAA